MQDFSVSIVTHGSPVEEITKAVGCLIKCSRVREVNILDNSGSDLPERYRRAFDDAGIGPLVRIRKIPNNGYGAGHNVALRESIDTETKYHLVMNSDVCWEGDVLTELCSVLDSRPDIGLIMPKVFYPDGALQLTARRLPTPYDVFAKRFLPDRLTRNRISRYLLERADHDREIDSPYLLGSFMLFRVEALRECGIFDERFFMYPEDIDISRRVHAKYKCIYYPGVSIVHEHKAASRRSFKMLRIHVANMVKYFNKWGWWIDPERRAMNRRLEKEIVRLPESQVPLSRG